MPWVRLEDGYYEHPKIVAAGWWAEILWVRAIAYSSRNETDGFLSNAVISRLTIEHREHRQATKAVRALVREGLFEEVNGGYLIHDFHDYQPSKAENTQRRAATRARVAKWRTEHLPSSNGHGNSVTSDDR